ncbi:MULTISPECIES: DUF3750 domain-containing protein [unclassified Synechocystis]|uniref:DUF3750 domain-containing protein n=1 Tax=unclassified Synechocystis TaxID=2640012 RepID=UPI0004089E28|nr:MULTISPECIES: DUF3750 domain-containing protein [unclassified Synechocystis]AIE73958.1 hypothetical protein D082_14300 [Synechocystis sp. PCC 6714]MCT0252521.1 DUF3750 domain-containing protein [Synechocystis sp. CS-94]
MAMEVQLRWAKIPFVGRWAVHYWYVIGDRHGQTLANVQRWEVWQRRELKPQSWGHLHRNLLAPQAGVGNGPSFLAQQWSGSLGDRLGEIILHSPHTYPHCYSYRYWPGPNSNTYAQWVLEQAAIDFDLGWRGVGRGYGKLIFPRFSHGHRQLER